MIHTINNNNNINKIVLMYTYTDLMKELVYLPDIVFISIVKSLHLIINTLNHVGHELAISHYHTKYKVQVSQVIVKLHVLQFRMLPTVKLADMNVAPVQVMQMTKLQSIYK